MVFNLVYVQTNNRQQQKCKQNSGNFDHHPDAAVQCAVHCLMEHIRGFKQSH
jgi:hypothetical protein